MDTKTKVWKYIMIAVVVGGYIPIAIGGYQHPAEINMASYGLWLMLAFTFFYSSLKQGFEGWLMPIGYLVGNAFMLILGFILGDYTFNLGPAEYVVLFGLTGVVSLWVAVGQITKRWNPRILFYGSILVDLISFYPQAKQYLLPHEPMTIWGFAGWGMWLLGAVINVIWVDGFFAKWQHSQTKKWLIVEASFLSFEQIAFMSAMIAIMAWC